MMQLEIIQNKDSAAFDTELATLINTIGAGIHSVQIIQYSIYWKAYVIFTL